MFYLIYHYIYMVLLWCSNSVFLFRRCEVNSVQRAGSKHELGLLWGGIRSRNISCVINSENGPLFVVQRTLGDKRNISDSAAGCQTI